MQKIFGRKEKTQNSDHAPLPPPRTKDEHSSNSAATNLNGNGNGVYYPAPKSESKVLKSEEKQIQNGPQSNERQKLVFHCQQAQGSPTGLISGFTNVREMYQKIADCYAFPVEDILFCTLNTHRIDMDNLLNAQLCLDDFIFVHRKGTKKEVEVTKTEDALGLTITDNGTGYAFIKRIKQGSVIDKIKAIEVGDHIEKIDGESLIGWRHVAVAKFLKSIPVGKTFIIRLIEPLKAGFANIGPKWDAKRGKSGKSLLSGKETLRFRSTGPAKIEEAPDNYTTAAIERINDLLEKFLGINDLDLATQIWEIGEGMSNTMEFAEALDNSELESFGFTDEFIIDIWGIVTDAKSGRFKLPSTIKMNEEYDEDFTRLTNSIGRKGRVK